MEPKSLDGGDNLLDASEAALADDGGSNDSIAAIAGVVLRFLEHFDDVEHKAFVADGTEGAADDAGSAGDALVVVDDSFVLVVDADCLHLAAFNAGTFLRNDGAIGTGGSTLATFDAFGFVDMASVVDNGYGSFGTDLFARVHKASATDVGDNHSACRTFIAGFRQHFNHVGIFLVASHSYKDSIHKHSSLFVDAASSVGFRPRSNGTRNGVGIIESTLISAPDDFLEHLVFNPLYVCIE